MALQLNSCIWLAPANAVILAYGMQEAQLYSDTSIVYGINET